MLARLALGMAAFALTVLIASRAGAEPDPRWPDGVVQVWAETQGMTDSMIFAAARWNRSGADLDIRVMRDEKDADVIVRLDDDRLRARCGRKCFGHASGTEILMRESLERPTPLSVWVAAHELGHVLGLRHKEGPGCALMSPLAQGSRCAPSLAAWNPDSRELRCIPAPADVDAAAALYGGAAKARDPRCQ